MDAMAEIRLTFFQECEEQLSALENGLISMQQGESDSETVNAVFRAVHSIKGGAGAFRLDALVGFAHVFETALDRVRSGALVPDADMQFMKTGLTGSMRLAGLPEQSFDFDIATITPVARVADGVNGFEVIGPLRAQDQRVRPGMEGVAKIPVGRYNLVWIWTHELMAWLRVKLWAWIP